MIYFLRIFVFLLVSILISKSSYGEFNTELTPTVSQNFSNSENHSASQDKNPLPTPEKSAPHQHSNNQKQSFDGYEKSALNQYSNNLLHEEQSTARYKKAPHSESSADEKQSADEYKQTTPPQYSNNLLNEKRPITEYKKTPQHSEKDFTQKKLHKKTQRVPDKNSNVIFMSPGEYEKLKSPAGERILLSQSGIITVSENNNQIVLKARKIGSLFLEKGSKTLFIQVLEKSKKHGLSQFIQHVENTPWLDWGFSEKQIELTGAVYRFSAWKALAEISQKHQLNYITKAHISHKVRKEAQDFFSKHVSDFKIFWTTPLKAATAEKPQPLFSHYGIISEKNEDLFPSPLIKLRLTLSEMNLNQAKKWNFSSAIQLVETSFIQKQFLNNQGESNIFSEAVLITENKQPAHFLFGGEAPVHSYNYESKAKNINWKDYGLSVTLTPHVKNNFQSSIKSVFLDFSVEISEIDPAYSSEGSPASKTHRLSSKIHLPEEKTLCLSSLKRLQTGKSSHTPFMLSIPLVGSLLHSGGKSKEKSQAVICITPEILKTSFLKKKQKQIFSSLNRNQKEILRKSIRYFFYERLERIVLERCGHAFCRRADLKSRSDSKPNLPLALSSSPFNIKNGVFLKFHVDSMEDSSKLKTKGG